MSSQPKKPPNELRSQQWFGRQDRDGFAYRSWVKGKGVPHDQFDGRPVIGICNTFSELTPCNSHFRTLAEQVKIGVYEAGGFPLEFPVMSLGETLLRPTAMLYRNLASMDVEESIRGNPIDGVVLLMGCDKTTPSLLMGAASVNLPTIGVSGGPMLNGKWRGQELGSGTGVWSMSEQVRAGTLKLADFFEAESCMHRSHGHCMTMGTASTMASMVEALGIGLPGNAAYPAVDGRRNVLARNAGRRIVEMVHSDQTIAKILTMEAFENAIRTLAAIGGSTNAVIHLIAIAGRLGLKLTVEDFDRLASDLPCLVNLQPSGEYLMEDFCYAGGLPVVMKEIAHLLHADVVTASGKTVRENIASAQNYDPRVIKTFQAPFKDKAGIAVLHGNLAPRGAVIKPSAASPALMVHTGRAVVFENIEDFHSRIDDENLDVDEHCVLVLKNCGPKGYPGMAEVGNMPLPPKVLRKGITDMVRISDARMSGTAYGTVVLHAAPEAAAGGPMAVVQNGDLIELNVPARKLHLHISDDELARRLGLWTKPVPPMASGYWKLYVDHVLQADQGADLDFLVGMRGNAVPRDNHLNSMNPTVNFGHAGRVVVITGAAQGIGAACARRFSREQAQVVLLDIDDARGEALAQELGAHYLHCDVGDRHQVDSALARTLAAYKRIDVLVNNAGIFKAADFLDVTEEDFDAVLRINLKGSFLVGQAVAREMSKAGRGSIVNMSSVNAVLAIPNIASYNVSKGGINQLTRVMALALAPYNIRVNAVAPGTISTELAARAVLTSEEAKTKILSRTPMKRLGEPSEVADVVAWLASDAATYVTGEIVVVDGGRMTLNYTVAV